VQDLQDKSVVGIEIFEANPNFASLLRKFCGGSIAIRSRIKDAAIKNLAIGRRNNS